MKNILFLILVVLSSSSIADDKKSDANDIPQQTVSVSTQPNVDAFNYFDDEKNLAKLAEKVSSLNKEKRDALEILDKVDSFYSKSFNALLLLIIAMIGIVGVAIPLVISFYQTRLLKKQNSELKKSIDNEVSIKLSDLKASLYLDNKNEMLKLEDDVIVKIDGVISKIKSEYRDEINKAKAESLARINHLGAVSSIVNKEYGAGAVFYFYAGVNYIEYNNHRKLRSLIEVILREVIKQIPSDYREPLLNKAYDEFIKKLSLFNVDSIYSDNINELELAWRDFEKRVEATNNDETS
ncbi:hypothetical protein H4F49_21880 [Pectobacterium polaris]|nr:hypothetical protein [Pectobacterium polaris]MBN3083270.1 hypothetical protein [Pectobacterium polaris]